MEIRLEEKDLKRVVVCLGSNVEPRMEYLDRAQVALCEFPSTKFVAASSTRETEPVDVPPEFADKKFLNRVVVLETALSPGDFARRMFAVEDSLGRVRDGRRNAPRTIDVDMIDYEGVVSDDPVLTLPHPRAAARAFVTEPLEELGIELPGRSDSMAAAGRTHALCWLAVAVVAVYALSAFFFTPRLRHAWKYLLMNPGRTYAQFVRLSAATCVYPWCYPDARRTYLAVRSREPIGMDDDGIDRYRMTARLVELLPSLFPGRKCVHFDARMKSMADFAERHRATMAECGGYRLWCIGRYDYYFVSKTSSDPAHASESAADFFALFSEKFDDFAEAGIYAPADVFACYVGDDAEVGPAFDGVTSWDRIASALLPGRLAFRPSPPGGRAQADPTFVTPTQAPEVSWMERGNLSAKVYYDFVDRVDVVQSVRRDVLLGFTVAAQGGSSATNALSIWANAAAGNPRDPLLVNLADTFDRQARQFLGIGNVNGALQCYENRLVVFPRDVAAMNNFAVCLKRAGHAGLAKQVFARARAMYNSMEKQK